MSSNPAGRVSREFSVKNAPTSMKTGGRWLVAASPNGINKASVRKLTGKKIDFSVDVFFTGYACRAPDRINFSDGFSRFLEGFLAHRNNVVSSSDNTSIVQMENKITQ